MLVKTLWLFSEIIIKNLLKCEKPFEILLFSRWMLKNHTWVELIGGFVVSNSTPNIIEKMIVWTECKGMKDIFSEY